MLERDALMKNWDALRCTPFLMFASPFVKPENDQRSSTEFATENFSFCIKELSQAALQLAMAPITAVLGQHISIGDIIGEILNSIRYFLKVLYDAFLSFIQPFLKRFMAGTYQLGIIAQHLRTAFQRVNAIMVSFIFIGLSSLQGLQNFIDTVINIILIICGIMLAIIIILFFVLFPFIPLIITVLTVISAVVIGSAASAAADMKGGFCFTPDTPIRLKSGLTKSISELVLGDELDPIAGTVEGLLVFDGSTTPLYLLEGIRVSGSHLVQDTEGIWRSVETDPRAVRIHETVPLLYCLTTSHRIIPAVGHSSETIRFRDWEEIDEEDVEGQQGWDLLIQSMLGMNTTGGSAKTFYLMSPAMRVRSSHGHTLRLDEVSIGDFIECEGGLTRILGIVKGQIQGTPQEEYWTSACIQQVNGKWTRVSTGMLPSKNTELGHHLITESGTFLTNQGLFRDFTEIGYDRIQETYPFVADRLLNYGRKQKINNRYLQKKA